MTKEALRAVVMQAVKKETGYDVDRIDPDKDIRSQVNLDSMQFVGILARVEEALAVELPIEAVTVSTLNQFLEVLAKQVVMA
jgi:acyl carrier protein